MPASFLVAGDSQISIANLQSGDNFNEPPYVLLGVARVGGAISPAGLQVKTLPGG